MNREGNGLVVADIYWDIAHATINEDPEYGRVSLSPIIVLSHELEHAKLYEKVLNMYYNAAWKQKKVLFDKAEKANKEYQKSNSKDTEYGTLQERRCVERESDAAQQIYDFSLKRTRTTHTKKGYGKSAVKSVYDGFKIGGIAYQKKVNATTPQ